MLQRTLSAGLIAPCLPTKTDRLPSGSQWLHEIPSDHPVDRYSPNGVYGISAASLRLDARGLDHLGPLLGFVGDELAEIGGRARQRRTTHIGKPRLHFGIGEGSVDLLVELLDDLSWCGLRCADAEPGS
jgi:hypothetical protein